MHCACVACIVHVLHTLCMCCMHCACVVCIVHVLHGLCMCCMHCACVAHIVHVLHALCMCCMHCACVAWIVHILFTTAHTHPSILAVLHCSAQWKSLHCYTHAHPPNLCTGHLHSGQSSPAVSLLLLCMHEYWHLYHCKEIMSTTLHSMTTANYDEYMVSSLPVAYKGSYGIWLMNNIFQ